MRYKLLGCSDIHCMFVKNTVGTNGGCRCVDTLIEDRRLAKEIKFAFRLMQETGSARIGG